MKVLLVNGSPRKGSNTEGLLGLLEEKIKGPGIEIDNLALRSVGVKHCLGCYTCKRTGKCKQHDEMADLLERLIDSDVIVVGSPTYVSGVPGLLKDFLDRVLPIYWPKRLSGKVGTWVVTEAADSGEIVALSIHEFYRHNRMLSLPGIVCKGEHPGDALKIEGNSPLVDRLAGQIAGLASRLAYSPA